MSLYQSASRLAQRASFRLFKKPARKGTAEAGREPRAILIGLMTPLVMVVLQGAMIAVALPDMRSSFDADADIMAWVVTGFTLSFMILMPLYGRLGDGFGKRALLLAGIFVFVVGVGISILASTLPMVVLGRVIQGAGASAVMPLTIAMIAGLFPANQRGSVLGTWTSVAPASSLVATLFAGLLIATWGWRSVFGPALAVGLLAPIVLRRNVPEVPGNAQPGFLRGFDWPGVILICATVTTLLFYISSRSITGVPALRDWRLLTAVFVLAGSFIFWEKRRSDPFISLSMFDYKSFTQASLCAAARMFAVAGLIFLIPLYSADVLGLQAAGIGLLLAIHAGALFATMWLGGVVADRRGSRWPVVAGLSVEVGILVYFALLSSATSVPLLILGLAVHGLGAGLAQAPLDRAATGSVPQAQIGAAAGVYSMIRFGGALLGPTLAGVLLQQGLERGLLPTDAYQPAFWLVTGAAFVGVLVGLTLRE